MRGVTRCDLGIILAALCLLASVRQAAGQDGPGPQAGTVKAQTERLLSHGSEIFIAGSGTLFEARLAEPLAIFRAGSVFGLPDSADVPGRWFAVRQLWPNALTIVPEVSIRMSDTPSLPIHHPSYHPRLTAQWLSASNREREATLPARVRWWNRINEFHLVVGHHSNGQDGCFFVNQVRRGDDCVLPDGEEPGAVNALNGSFSTNYWQAGWRWRWNRLRPDGVGDTAVADRDISVGADGAWHFDMGDAQLFRTYGRARLTGTVQLAEALEGRLLNAMRGRAVLAVHGTLVHKPQSSFIWTVQGAYYFSRQGGWGIFARNYQGQDYYNIMFGTWTQRWHIGVVHSRDGFLMFGK